MNRKKQKQMTPPEKFILEAARREGSVTNWGWNENFLDFWDKFYFLEPKESVVKQKFRYYANKLVKKGYLEKAVRMGLGPGGYSEFGVRTQTTWLLNKETR